MSKTIFKNLHFLSLFLLLSAFGPCSATGSNSLTSDGVGAETSGGGSSEGSSGDSSGAGTTNAVPIGSIDMPAAKIDVSQVIAYNSDQANMVPVVGNAASAEYSTGNQVAVSTSEITALNETTSNSHFARAMSVIIPLAQASESTDICTEAGVTCCPVLSDGSFQCFYQLTDSSVEQLYVALVKTDGTVSENSAEAINGNLLYTGSAPTSVSVVGDKVYSITNGIAVKAEIGTDEKIKVSGDHANTGGAYRSFDTTGTKLAYGSSDDLIGVMGGSSVQLLDVASGTATDTGETGCTATKTSTPAVIKTLNGMIYCGHKETVGTDTAELEYVTTAEKKGRSNNNIKIIAPEDGLTHIETIAFDEREVGLDPWNIVLYSDGSNIRIRAVQEIGSASSQRLGGDIWKALNDVSIKDIIFYHDQNTTADYSRFAILDSKNNKVWFGKVNVDTSVFEIHDANSVSVGANPQAMYFSEASGKLYVLNRDDQSINVIPLMAYIDRPVRSIPIVTETLYLADVAPDKTITFVPNSMTMSGNKLIVSDETTKALVLVDVSTYETALTAFSR